MYRLTRLVLSFLAIGVAAMIIGGGPGAAQPDPLIVSSVDYDQGFYIEAPEWPGDPGFAVDLSRTSTSLPHSTAGVGVREWP